MSIDHMCRVQDYLFFAQSQMRNNDARGGGAEISRQSRQTASEARVLFHDKENQEMDSATG